MKLYQSASLEVSFNASQNLLVLHCQGEVTSEDYKEGFMMALQFARINQVKNWLLDLSQVMQLTDEVVVWVQVHVFPQLMAYLGTDNYMALVVSDLCYDEMLREYGLEGLQTYNCFIKINTFYAPDSAIEWLDAHTTVQK